MTESHKTEMERLITLIDAHRVSLGLTHARFATRFARFVGSHKSWEHRLFARKWDELKPETWLPKLHKFVGEIEGAVGDQVIHQELPIVKHACYLFDTLKTQTNDRRCAMLLGTQGTGKTLSLRHVQRINKYGPAFMSANETWKDSRMRIAHSWAVAIGATSTPSASQTWQNCIDHMKANPCEILIDEAHEGGVLLMKLIKCAINEASVRVMMGIYPTAWKRLTNGGTDAYEEAQQLLRRTIRPVRKDWLKGINISDVEAWTEASKLKLSKAKITELLPTIRAHGNYSLLQDALDRATLLANEQDDEVSTDLFCSQVIELCAEPKIVDAKPGEEKVAA